ncbi:MAG TPA: GNAT family N-acetyltransferase [Dehalococcoidia bacterium]
MPGEITFVRLTRDDLPMIHRWLNNAEVALWYGVGDDNRKNPTMEEVVAEYEENFVPDPKKHAFIVHLDGRPVGYIQCYRLGDYPDYAKEMGEDPDAWAIDILVGEDDARERGIGSRAIEQLLEEQVFARPEVTTCFISPDPDNKRAIRAYEKAGFRYVKEVWIESEKAREYVMRRDRDTDA